MVSLVESLVLGYIYSFEHFQSFYRSSAASYPATKLYGQSCRKPGRWVHIYVVLNTSRAFTEALWPHIQQQNSTVCESLGTTIAMRKQPHNLTGIYTSKTNQNLYNNRVWSLLFPLHILQYCRASSHHQNSWEKDAVGIASSIVLAYFQIAVTSWRLGNRLCIYVWTTYRIMHVRI